MKKKFIYILIVGIIIVLFIPTPKKLDDDGIQYNALVYKIISGKEILDNKEEKYLEIYVFGKKVYSNKKDLVVDNQDNQEKKELKIEDIVSEDGLLFSVQSNKSDCVHVLLEIYRDNTFKFKFAHIANKEVMENSESILYSKIFASVYEYDVLKIINSSINVGSIKNSSDYDYEITTGKDGHKYVLNKDNEYLSEFLTLVNLNLDTCSEEDYME